MHWRWGGGGVVGEKSSEVKVFAMWCETRGWITCKINVRIYAAERIQGCIGIKQNNPFNRKISVEWEEPTCVN